MTFVIQHFYYGGRSFQISNSYVKLARGVTLVMRNSYQEVDIYMILLSGQLKPPLFAIGIINSYAEYAHTAGNNYPSLSEITGPATAQLVCDGLVLLVKVNLNNITSNR